MGRVGAGFIVLSRCTLVCNHLDVLTTDLLVLAARISNHRVTGSRRRSIRCCYPALDELLDHLKRWASQQGWDVYASHVRPEGNRRRA